MIIMDAIQLANIKQYMYKNARLLERQMFAFFFGSGSKQACFKALAAYQNADGGFGNGIEPDLICPDSTGIGAETALFVMDLLDDYDSKVLERLVHWIEVNLDATGAIPHPPQSMFDYPHQPWWKNPDAERILAIAGYLKKLKVDHTTIYQRVSEFYTKTKAPAPLNYYSYPHFVYLKYVGEDAESQVKLSEMVKQVPNILKENADHFPLFSRAWYHAVTLLDRETVTAEAQKFANAFLEDGGLNAPYPDLPWWRPIWTLDGLILLKRFGYL